MEATGGCRLNETLLSVILIRGNNLQYCHFLAICLTLERHLVKSWPERPFKINEIQAQ